MTSTYDAILVVGFGGPERPQDVIPFLENVLRGRAVPRERMLEVAEHYQHCGGRSPLNDQMRDLIVALRVELETRKIYLPVYWGNRNWHPLLPDTLREMAVAGVGHALALVAAAYSSYSSCRQYLENLESARLPLGDRAPHIDKLRPFFNHPLFIAANADRLRSALAEFPAAERHAVKIAFTAHSIPASMAKNCAYEMQLRETCRQAAEAAEVANDHWTLVFQSRSGRPQDPWLEPDILDHLRDAAKQGASELVVMPIGFLSDHMEVLYDLDYEARQVAGGLGLRMVRAATVGTHPLFVRMIGELVAERLSGGAERAAIGNLAACPDTCPADCCPPPRRG
ncbi:MAG: ferrochelatase [Planctomycetaceae bacterium]